MRPMIRTLARKSGSRSSLTAVKFDLASRKSAISVVTRASAELEKTKYVATAKIELFFDLKNGTNTPSPELEAIYFYTGKGWKFTQDSQECSSTESDRSDFPLQHFVKAPVRRLAPGGWAQVKLLGEKRMGYSWSENQPLKDKYRLQGKTMVRLVTNEGQYDFPGDLDLEAEELPF
jgi:hypothetical protein